MNTKVYVSVIVEFDIDGNMTPLSFVWEDGRRYEIDRILDVRPAASLKAGGSGMRYTVRIMGKETYLFFDLLVKRWFKIYFPFFLTILGFSCKVYLPPLLYLVKIRQQAY